MSLHRWFWSAIGVDVSVSPEAVANEFLALARRDGRALTNMKLQKLVYIAHGYTLAILDEPLIARSPQAWQYGPVFPSLYRELREFGSGEVTGELEASDRVTDDVQKEVIVGVWDAYGGRTGVQLSALTHKPGSPWAKHYNGERSVAIPDEVIKEHYDQLLNGVDDGVR